MQPSIMVWYEAGIPTAPFQDFSDALSNDELFVQLEERPSSGPLAGIMWMMMTQAAVFFAASYFGGMLKELGKDHYEILKKSLARLTDETMNLPKIEPTLIGTSGKLQEGDPISMAFSVWAQLPNSRATKLLIPKNTGKVDYSSATDAFLDFVADCHERGELALFEAGYDISKKGNPITVVYDVGTRKIQWANPHAL